MLRLVTKGRAKEKFRALTGKLYRLYGLLFFLILKTAYNMHFEFIHIQRFRLEHGSPQIHQACYLFYALRELGSETIFNLMLYCQDY